MLKKLILVASDMIMKFIAMLKYVMHHIKTISMKRQSKCNEQHDEVPKPQEVDFGGLGHGHEVHSSVEIAVLK